MLAGAHHAQLVPDKREPSFNHVWRAADVDTSRTGANYVMKSTRAKKAFARADQSAFQRACRMVCPDLAWFVRCVRWRSIFVPIIVIVSLRIGIVPISGVRLCH